VNSTGDMRVRFGLEEQGRECSKSEVLIGERDVENLSRRDRSLQRHPKAYCIHLPYILVVKRDNTHLQPSVNLAHLAIKAPSLPPD
jgi:hypothetical protein